ncbi:MAG: branched-chain amino acid ABC transporter permease [Bacteroidota bacterium]
MDLKTSYYEDIQLFPNRATLVWSLVLLLGLGFLPILTNSYVMYVASLMAVNVIVALGLNLLVGNTGQISLGHAGFVAIGAYTSVLLITKIGVPFLLAMVLGGVVAAAFGALLAIPALRLEGPYLAIATLGFGLAVTVLIGRTPAFGGHMGISVPRLDIGLRGAAYDQVVYYVIAGITVLMTVFARNLLKSRIGRAFQAVRDSDIAASALGVNIARYKTLSFSISAFYAGIAGALWALLLGFINPLLFSFTMSVVFLATIVMGGLGSVTGSVLGAIVMTFLSLQLENVVEIPLLGPALEAFSAVVMTPSGIANISWVFTGLILICVVLFEPLGLFGLWLRTKIYWKTWPF